MQRMFRVVNTSELTPIGVRTTTRFNRSVRRYGVINPVLLAEVPDEDGVIGLRIVDGNRRIRAARSERVSRVPAVVLKATSAKDRARLTLICNYMRSSNFHTESLAITSLAEDEADAEQAAGMMGLAPGKILKLFSKIDKMPAEVRQAMYEHRMPVTAATSIGNWPDELQDEVVALLGTRRYVDTRTIQSIKKAYDDLHAEPAPVPVHDQPEPVAASTSSVGWADVEPVVIDESSPVPPTTPAPAPTLPGNGDNPIPGPSVVVSPGPARPASVSPFDDGSSPLPSREPSVSQHIPKPDPASQRMDSAPNPDPQQVATVDAPVPSAVPPVTAHQADVEPARPTVSLGQDSNADRPSGESVETFIARLDEMLMELAREATARHLSRSVWVDRTMRAWQRVDGGNL